MDATATVESISVTVPNVDGQIFFFNDTATTEIYTLSLHDALPISCRWAVFSVRSPPRVTPAAFVATRSEEHTSELQSRENLVCRLLLEKKKKHTSRPQKQKKKKIKRHQH